MDLMFDVVAVTAQHDLLCPSCEKPVLEVHPEQAKVPGGGTWMRDGDTVAGLYDLLSEEQKTPDGFDYTLMVGKCPACCKDYYGVFAHFMQTTFDEGEPYLHLSADLGPERNFLCLRSVSEASIPSQWVMHENLTQAGLMHQHVFGPFTLDSTEGVEGPFGVAACSGGNAGPWEHARVLLRTVWDSLREHCRLRNLHAVQQGTQ